MSNRHSGAATFPSKRQMSAEKIIMKAIVVTDQAAGTAGMTLVERPEPRAAINDVIVQICASGFVPTELAWPSTWTDRRDRDRTPSIPGHEVAGVVTALGYGDGPVGRTASVRSRRLVSRRHPGGVYSHRGTQPRAAAGRRRLHGGREPANLGPHRAAGTVPARPSSGGAERPRARRGRRSRLDGYAART